MDYEELSQRWRSFNAPANIYRIDPEIGSLDDISDLAQRVGLSGTTAGWTEFGPLLELSYGTQIFTVYRPSGAVQYVDNRRWQVDDGSAMDVSDEGAVEAALRVVERLGLAGQDVFTPTKVTRLSVASARKGERPLDTRVVDVGVVLSRVIDGVRVEGQGGCIVMYLDANFAITGFERVARRIAGVHASVAGLRPLDDVLGVVEEYWGVERDRGLAVDDARLAYLEFGRLQEQEYIQPVYVLDLSLSNPGNGDARTVQHCVPAAVNSVGDVMPVDSGPPPQGRRTPPR